MSEEKLTVEIKPIVLDGVSYVTVTQMAVMTNRSDQSIYSLVLEGNSIRKMKVYRIAGRTLIPLSELTDFPFTFAGPHSSDNPYHYDKNGIATFAKGADQKKGRN